MGKVFIIAEIGVNHNGKLETAYKLIDAAADAGADAAKFQTYKTEALVTLNAPKAPYQTTLKGTPSSQYDMLKKYEMDDEMHQKLITYCKKRDILFLSSAFDLSSLDYLYDLGLQIFKVPSGEIDNLPYLRKLGGFNKNVILSTGTADLSEVKKAIEILISSGTGKEKITVLHCNTEYPTPFEDVNLYAMLTIKNELGVKIGYSDHTQGIEVSIAAVAMGAEVIEKHITLDNTSTMGPDHRASLDSKKLKKMVVSIRNIEKALGDGIKDTSKSEAVNKQIVRKSIVASRSIKRGEYFSENNITVKRPGGGLSPIKWDIVIASKADKDYSKDEMIELK